MSKFTLGPWGSAARQGDDWDSVVYTQINSDNEICQCFHERGNEDECEANARLIAAAPALYYAAVKALDECCDLIGTPAGDALKAAIEQVDGAQ